MKSSYKEKDVVLLLKDITGLVKPQSTEEREKLIQSGKHYCEMLPIEYVPSEKYMEAYRDALKNYARQTAGAVGSLADKIISVKGRNIVLVSLARAGIPAGILIKRYLKWKYQINPAHYSISIIRGMGIDKNAVRYILQRHKPEHILFVDGWIGKGAILNELEQAVKEFADVSSELAVLADPAGITELCGTHEDLLIPSSCLNSTISGLISRTFFRWDIIGENDFHGAVYYENLKDVDLSYEFIYAIEAEFIKENREIKKTFNNKGIDEVKQIAQDYNIGDINLIKPGIGETTRVLLRRVPWKVLIGEEFKNDAALEHIKRLADEKGVEIEYYPLKHYKSCGIIKRIADM